MASEVVNVFIQPSGAHIAHVVAATHDHRSGNSSGMRKTKKRKNCLFQRHGSIGMAMEAQFSPSRREKRMNRNNRLWSRYPGW